ncbi:MAG: protein kinase [Acutalibacteraceae bacterium]
MDREKLRALEPFFDGWHLDNIIDQRENYSLYRVMKTSPDGSVSFRDLKVISVKTDPPHSDGEYPDDIKLQLLPLEIMQKMRNCDQIVSYYDSRVVYNGDGEYMILSLRESVKALSDEYDIHDLPVATALKIVVTACEAVEQFRSMGITHENISLENIFVDGLGDFKLGSFVNTGANDDCKAPEEYSHSGDPDQSDMYALGMLLFKALNRNRAPFLPQYPIEVTEENLSNALQRRINGEVPTAPENAPSGIDKIIEKACAFKPASRYQNLGSIKRDIEAILSEIEPTYSSKTSAVTGYAFGQSVPKAQREPQEDQNGEIEIKDDGSINGYGFDGDNYYDNSHEESNKVIKGLIAAIIAVAVISVGLISYSMLGGGAKPTTTQPTTASTTQPTTAAPTTTQPTTTAPTTTQPTTTQPTVPPVPTDATTKPTMSTTVITTKPTTTTKAKLQYVEVENPEIELIENDGRVDEILIFADATFGANVKTDGQALLYSYDENGTIVKTQPLSIECYYDIDHRDATVCDIIVPSDAEIDTDNYRYELFVPKDTIQGYGYKNEAFSVEF